MFGQKKSTPRTMNTYYALYLYQYLREPEGKKLMAADDLAAKTAALAIEGTESRYHKLIGVLRADGSAIDDSSESERHTADLERELGYR